MSSIFNVLGTDIIVNAIVYASDVDEVQRFVINELNRRGIAAAGASSLTPGSPGYASVIQNINTNIRNAGYTGASTIAQIPTAAEIKSYVDYAKTLYSRILKP